MYSIEAVQTEIRKAAQERILDPKKIDRSRRAHRNVKLTIPIWKRAIGALSTVRHNKHDLIALIYRIPLIGSVLNLLAYSIRVHKHIIRLREEIINCHFEISSTEIRIMQQASQDFILLNKRIAQLEGELAALKAKHEGVK